MLTYLEDTFDAINELLELIKEEAELKTEETQMQLARDLEEINIELNRLYSWLVKEF